VAKYQQLIPIFPLDIKSLSFRNKLTTLAQILLSPITARPKSCSAKILLDPIPNDQVEVGLREISTYEVGSRETST